MKEFVQGKVEKVMTKDVVTVTPGTTVMELEKLFEKYGYNMFPVMKKNQLVGVVSEFDFLKAFVFFGSDLQNPSSYKKIAKEKKVKDICSTPLTVSKNHPLTYVMQLMVNSSSKSFPVVNDKGKLMGVISRKDLITALKD